MELFSSIFEKTIAGDIVTYEMTTGDFFICLGLALALGLVMSLCYMFKNKSYYHHNANNLFEFNLFSDFQLPFAHRSPFFCSIVMTNILVVATSKV